MCTAIYVGKDISEDGSILIARCEDDGIDRVPVLKRSAAKRNNPPLYQSLVRGGSTSFEYPLPQISHALLHVPNWPAENQNIRSSVGINERGVIVSATQTIFARDLALSVDPYLQTGMTEDDLTNLLLESASCAKEAVDLLGNSIEKKGAAEGMAAFIGDDKEQWLFETGSAHQWLARKLPADRFLAYANQGRLTHYEKSDNYKASPNLVEFALKNNLFQEGREFSFSQAYSRNDYRDANYNIPRVEEIERIIGIQKEEENCDDIFHCPSKKISRALIRSLMRDYYAGTVHDPYGLGLRGNEKWRPISIFRTTSAHIVRIRPWLPPEIGRMFYLALGMPIGAVFLPIYSGFTDIPSEYVKTPSKCDSFSAYWKFRKLQTLVMRNFERYGKWIIGKISKYEENLESKEHNFESDYLRTFEKNPERAHQQLNEFSKQTLCDAIDFVDNLANGIFYDLTKQTNEEILMLNGLSPD